MADLDFSHNVQQIPAGEPLPEPYQRKVGAETSNIPNFQAAYSDYAANTNWMSSIGSAVAAKASNALATKLGGEIGKNPQGNLSNITDFDKTLNESYQTQAHATLGLQADKLITNSNLEMAKAPRITPDLIAKTHKQVSIGLQNIFGNAPMEIRPQLESQYGAQQISQTANLTERMLRENKEDRQNTLDLSSKTNSENAYSAQLAGVDLDKNGDSKAALASEEALRRSYDSAVAMRDKSPLERQVAVDTARQSRLSAKQIRLGLIAQQEGKEAEFRKSLADSPPKDIKPEDHEAVYRNVISYLDNQNALRSQDENLKSQLMYNRIITNPSGISGTDWASFEQSVSPLKAAEMKFHLIQARNKKDSSEVATNTLLANYQDARVQANASPEVKNAAFNKSVIYTLQKNPQMNQDEAEVQVAMTAAVPAPVFTQTLKGRLWSGDAAQMVGAARQIDALQLSGNGHAISGLNDTDLAIASDISHNNNPADPAWASRVVTENRENQDPVVKKQSESAWSSYIYDNTIKKGTSEDDFILSKFGLGGGYFSSGFDSPWLKGKYASDIMDVYRQNYINTRRDTVRADALTQAYIKNNYGPTKINGKSEWTKHPIEKAVGFNEGEGLPSINKDIIRQTSEPMKNLKTAYDEKRSDIYWSIEQDEKSNRLQFVKYTRNGVSKDTERFPLKLVGNNFNWELNVETATGPMSVFLAAPMIGVHQYTPDIKFIKDDYLKNHQKPEHQNYIGRA